MSTPHRYHTRDREGTRALQTNKSKKSGIQLANCIECGQLFQKTLHPKCQACYSSEKMQFDMLYYLLQESAATGGILIEDAAQKAGMTVEEVEDMLVQGKLGTGAAYLKTYCVGCHDIIYGGLRKGRYCNKCSEKTANKVGVEVQSRTTVIRKHEQYRKQQDLHQKLEEQRKERTARMQGRNNPGENSGNGFGSFFKR